MNVREPTCRSTRAESAGVGRVWVDAGTNPYLLGTTKRAFDLFVALSAIILLLPLLVAMSGLIVLTSPGHFLFLQKRHGLFWRRFRIYKFRTMYTEKKPTGFIQAYRGDPRVTPLGRFMRATSIDELPQFFNVLFGQMSIVGPRPHPIELDEDFRPRIKGYDQRFVGKPGITGLAQTNGCRGETPNDETMQRRVDLDRRYLEEASLALDVKIVLRTAYQVMFGADSY